MGVGAVFSIQRCLDKGEAGGGLDRILGRFPFPHAIYYMIGGLLSPGII